MSIGKDLEKLEPLYTAGGNRKWYSRYEKQFSGSSKNYNRAIPLLGVYPKELKAGSWRNICPLDLEQHYSQQSKDRNNPNVYLQMNGYAKCGINTYNGILVNLKIGEILTHATTQMIPDDIILSEIIQTQKDKYLIPLI